MSVPQGIGDVARAGRQAQLMLQDQSCCSKEWLKKVERARGVQWCGTEVYNLFRNRYGRDSESMACSHNGVRTNKMLLLMQEQSCYRGIGFPT